MKKITLSFSLEELNIILGSLGKMPYEVSAKLIDSIIKAAQPQLDPPSSSFKTED